MVRLRDDIRAGIGSQTRQPGAAHPEAVAANDPASAAPFLSARAQAIHQEADRP